MNPFGAYRRKVGRLDYTLQLNVNNLLYEKVDGGNSYTWARSTEPRQYVTTLTVRFDTSGLLNFRLLVGGAASP